MKDQVGVMLTSSNSVVQRTSWLREQPTSPT
jgi:hypothetical protein